MENKTEEIIKKMKSRNETISTMESCTGGLLASEFTNISGSSDVFSLGLVTYQTKQKIKFGVPEDIVNKYTVYSKQVSEEMAKNVANTGSTTWGIGVTGIIGRFDPNVPQKDERIAFYTIYNSEQKKYITKSMSFKTNSRLENKIEIVKSVINDLNEELDK